MPKKIQLQRHLGTEELERRYRAARDGVERSQYQTLWLLPQGETTGQVMAATGYSRGRVQQLAKRYNEGGVAGLGDRRRRNRGAKGRALLSPEPREELGEALLSPPPDGGLWSGPKVARWIAERTGRRTHPQRGWEYLRRLGYTPQMPRPAHAEAAPEEQEEFRGNQPGGCGRWGRRTRRRTWSCGRWTSTG